MSRTLTASDRRSLIRLASTLPAGSEERRVILAGLVYAGRNPLSGFVPTRKPENAPDAAGARWTYIRSKGGKLIKVDGVYEYKDASRIWATKFEWDLKGYGPRTTVLKTVPGDPLRIEVYSVLNDGSWGYQGTIRSSRGNWTL
jgi:hypothetical protein